MTGKGAAVTLDTGTTFGIVGEGGWLGFDSCPPPAMFHANGENGC